MFVTMSKIGPFEHVTIIEEFQSLNIENCIERFLF